MLQNIIFPLNQIFKYNMTGKFKALFPEWKHNHAPLIDYELIIVTEWELFLSYLFEIYVPKFIAQKYPSAMVMYYRRVFCQIIFNYNSHFI